MSWSRRPGLRMAGSMMSGLFVAPMMKTFFLLDIPSISVRIWLMTRSAAPPPSPTLPPRALAMESSSSKKRTHGAAWRAWNHNKDPQNGFKANVNSCRVKFCENINVGHADVVQLKCTIFKIDFHLHQGSVTDKPFPPCQRSLWRWPQTLQTT